MNIGIISVWFECGAGYVTRQYKNILEKSGHKVFIFARGGHYPLKDPLYNIPEVTWAKPSRLPVSYSFDLKEFRKWLELNSIQVAFFNEQYWWEPIILCHNLGIKTGAYIDYYTKETVPLFSSYDFLICNTKRHFSVFNNFDQSFYIPWGTEIEKFRPITFDLLNQEFITFFHSCAATPERKGTDQIIKAFSLTSGPGKLVIHTQISINKKFPELRNLVNRLTKEGKLILVNKTVGAPGLYHLGDIYLYPSRLEGIGLTMAEALSSGLPLVTTDYPPMNEFVYGNNGWLIPVSKTSFRKDNYYWPMCEVDIQEFSTIIQELIDHREEIHDFKRCARDYAEKNLDWNKNSNYIDDIFRNTKIKSSREKQPVFRLINSWDYLNDTFQSRFYRLCPKGYSILHQIYRLYRDARTEKYRRRVNL